LTAVKKDLQAVSVTLASRTIPAVVRSDTAHRAPASPAGRGSEAALVNARLGQSDLGVSATSAAERAQRSAS
jgi:hypothetical protein